jgi:hypothetical protein
MRGSSGVVRRSVVTVSVLAAGLTVLGCHSASATLPPERATHSTTTTAPKAAGQDRAAVQKVKVDPLMFGVHDAHLTSLTHRSTRSIRLWDTGTTWPEVQPTATTWDFSRLDQVVAAAWKNHTEVTFVAAMTPTWALAHPVDPSSPFSPSTYAPQPKAYSAFLGTLMKRYKNYHHSGRPGIANYQVWNEANISTFWNSGPQAMAQLVKAAHDVRNSHDKKVRVIAPAMVTRLAYQQKWIKKFYQQKVARKPVWTFVNALSFNLYPLDTYGSRPATPEDSMTLLQQVRGLLAADKVRSSVPIWNTEVNYGMRGGSMGGHSAVPIPDDRQVAYIIRTFLLNASQGVRRVDWYAYDMGKVSPAFGGAPLGNTLLTDPDNQAAGTLTPAGLAFTRVQGWLKGGTLIGTRSKRPCLKDSHGTYTCTIQYAKGSARVYWNPFRTGKVKLPGTARTKLDEYGASTAVKGGARIKVGYQPVLVKSAH